MWLSLSTNSQSQVISDVNKSMLMCNWIPLGCVHEFKCGKTHYRETPWLSQIFVFQRSLCIVWIHNDSMYVRFGGTRNTKTWSKSSEKV